ncbi:MAG: glycosyltransferase family 4 protein [Planctomycetota bacterium]|jgi:glycosyltransferase involved in cell wall biosynthesis
MRILFITQWFQPEPFINGVHFIKELTKLGHEVQVLTGFPNYPGGKLYDGYRIKLLQREDMDGIPVVRVPLYPSHDRSGIRRFASYMSFALSAAIIGPWVMKRADVAYVYHPPATVCLPACVFRILRRVPFVYNVQDLWPDELAASKMFQNRFGLWLAERCCRLFYRLARKIVVLSPGFKETLCERGVRRDKIEVIYNWCADGDSDVRPVEKHPALRKELGLTGRFNILFAGNMGEGQALGTVLEAAEIVQNRCPRVQFVLIGGGTEADNLKLKAKDLNLKNVVFHDRRPPSEIGAILSLADVLLVHLSDAALHRITIPSKTQAYMLAGKPVLMGVRGDAAELVTRAETGLTCEPENPQSMADAVQKFEGMPPEELEAMGENGRRFYRRELALEIGARRYEEIFRMAARK